MLAAGIDWHESWIGDYHVYYRLSRPISPQALELYAEQGANTTSVRAGRTLLAVTAAGSGQASP